MGTVKATEPLADTGVPAAQAAIETWFKLNARVAQMCIDAGIAQIKGMQEFMTVRMKPLAPDKNGSAEDFVHAELALMRKQTDDAIKLTRRIADETRDVAFELADISTKIPFTATQLGGFMKAPD